MEPQLIAGTAGLIPGTFSSFPPFSISPPYSSVGVSRGYFLNEWHMLESCPGDLLWETHTWMMPHYCQRQRVLLGPSSRLFCCSFVQFFLFDSPLSNNTQFMGFIYFLCLLLSFWKYSNCHIFGHGQPFSCYLFSPFLVLLFFFFFFFYFFFFLKFFFFFQILRFYFLEKF